MQLDLDQRIIVLGVGEFAAFTDGPRGAAGLPGGLWRAQIGTQWHQELRQREAGDPAAEFEVLVEGRLLHRGWRLALCGRIDQLIARPEADCLREIKTVNRPLPAAEEELRAEHPGYFLQLAAYRALRAAAGRPARGELVFVEIATGLLQTVVAGPADDEAFAAQLERVVGFAEHRRTARERRRHLVVRPPFAAPRPGQERVETDLREAFGWGQAQEEATGGGRVVLFEAPTGFGKTGCVLHFALGALREGRFERVIYLTGKSTGQLPVVRQLQAMTRPAPGETGAPLASWQVRSKSEHCVNPVFHCLPDVCPFLAEVERRWPGSGLARHYLGDDLPRDLETLRDAGRAAGICPYEITRAALPFNDVWIGDYNYVFSPDTRGLFHDQPGFAAERTLLIVDEAHNLPARVADAWSRRFTAADAELVLAALRRVRAPGQLVLAWDRWTGALAALRPCDALPPAEEEELREAAAAVGRLLPQTALDYAALGPDMAATLWTTAATPEALAAGNLPWLWWCPRRGHLDLTCLDAAPAIGPALRGFGGALLLSATLSPFEAMASACGLDTPSPGAAPPARADAVVPLGQLSRRDRRTLAGLTTGAALLHVAEARDEGRPRFLRAQAPWREGAYRVAVDARVDTRFQERHRHYATTAATIARLCAHAGGRPVAVFFPSYAYAEEIARRAAEAGLRVALQPRGGDLAAQTRFLDEGLAGQDALLLVLGTGFAEGIDALGGRVSHAMVVGPALPEVNAVQRARLAIAPGGRDAAFRRVYQVPGMQKVNQALGRLVRAPGQRATVLLHCRRFAELAYDELLHPDYRQHVHLHEDEALEAWLAG